MQLSLEFINISNESQWQILDEVINIVMPRVNTNDLHAEASSQFVHGRLSFLVVRGGARKAFVTPARKRFLKSKSKNVVTVVYPAVAVQLFDDGRNAYSAFRIPIPVDQDNTCNVFYDFPSADDISRMDLIIWIEINMSFRHILEAVDRTLGDITNFNGLFDVKDLLLIGDFCQICSVVRQESRE